MKINWNFPGGRGVQNKKPSMRGVWIFPGTAHSQCTSGWYMYSAVVVTLLPVRLSFVSFDKTDGWIGHSHYLAIVLVPKL